MSNTKQSSQGHWNENVIILTKFSSLAALEVVEMTTSNAASDESLTFKHQETHGCVVSTVATDALVLKHQAISIHNAD